MSLNFFVGIIGFLVIPCLIVGFWRKRPLAAYITAMIVMFLVMISLPLIRIFQAMMIYGEGDPQLMAGQLSEAIVTGLIGLVLLGPILFLFQWFVLRRHRRKVPKVDADKTFS